MKLRPRDDLQKEPRESLTREEKRFVDSGVDNDRLTEIQALLNSATETEQATIGYKALLDLWRAFQSERDELGRSDAANAPTTPAVNRFF